MKVTNISDRPHRYTTPTGDHGYYWAPGETRDVPDDIGWLVVEGHPGKMELSYEEVAPPAEDEKPAAKSKGKE